MQKQAADDNSDDVLYIPVLNIPRQDYALKTEVTHCLRANNITADVLVFRDDIDLRTLHDRRKLVLTLVDFHVLGKAYLYLDEDVIEIIDHRKYGRHDEDDRKLDVTVEMVGSCCTLVTEKILETNKDILDETTVTLLLSKLSQR